MCGATRPARALEKPPWGLSPRVRGNQLRHCPAPSVNGPIPACAGQPWVNWDSMLGLGAYPRVCGATAAQRIQNFRALGLSPRVRGNHVQDFKQELSKGPIPACAGQPCFTLIIIWRDWAYPRVCGATVLGAFDVSAGTGLSPRVRGNRIHSGHPVRKSGPIPACAGQPYRLSDRDTALRAYPRVCGATRQPRPMLLRK